MPLETLKLNKADLKFAMNRMGVREQLWHNEETNTLVHCADNEQEKEFYTILKEKGMKAALEFRDQPFSPSTTLKEVYAAAWPFVLLVLGGMVLMVIFPQIATWIPSHF